MGSITLTQISNGQAGDATPVDNNFDTIANAINGNLDDSNLKSGAGIAADKLAATAITLGYAEITSSFATTAVSADADVTGLTVTVTVPSGGRRLRIEARGRNMYTTGAAGTNLILCIKEGSTVLSESLAGEPVSQYSVPAFCSYSAVASAGSHTYKVAVRQNAAGTMELGATATSPAYILVTLL